MKIRRSNYNSYMEVLATIAVTLLSGFACVIYGGKYNQPGAVCLGMLIVIIGISYLSTGIFRSPAEEIEKEIGKTNRRRKYEILWIIDGLILLGSLLYPIIQNKTTIPMAMFMGIDLVTFVGLFVFTALANDS